MTERFVRFLKGFVTVTMFGTGFSVVFFFMWAGFNSVVAERNTTHCYYSYRSTSTKWHGSEDVYTLTESVEWATDRDIGQFQTMAEVEEHARNHKCEIK